MFIDSHCHLDDESFAADLDAVLARGAEAGVAGYVVPGVSAAGWGGIEAVARRHRDVRPAFGLHPLAAAEFSAATLSLLESLLPEAVAVGEIGLDYAITVPREIQAPAFRSQLRLAVSRGLPVIIHCRRAFRDLLQICREERIERVGGVMHAFSGSVETARECLALGLCIGVAGPVTWENAVRPVAVARQVPADRLLLESDAPDLSPETRRGCRNEPAFLVETAMRVAEVRGVTLEELARTTTDNARRLFRL